MTVNSINNDNLYPVEKKTGINSIDMEQKSIQAIEERKSTQSPDKLEISSEGKKLQIVQARINSGYYDKPEVMKELAQKISRAFPPE
jgi:hypothetical protein